MGRFLVRHHFLSKKKNTSFWERLQTSLRKMAGSSPLLLQLTMPFFKHCLSPCCLTCQLGSGSYPCSVFPCLSEMSNMASIVDTGLVRQILWSSLMAASEYSSPVVSGAGLLQRLESPFWAVLVHSSSHLDSWQSGSGLLYPIEPLSGWLLSGTGAEYLDAPKIAKTECPIWFCPWIAPSTAVWPPLFLWGQFACGMSIPFTLTRCPPYSPLGAKPTCFFLVRLLIQG